MSQKTVIVVGAGASGMMAAIAAARAGASVILLEGEDRPGKKLLLTGNGRCNLTNTDSRLSLKYHGSGAALAQSITELFGSKKTLALFEELGLLTTEKNGYVYPYSGQSAAVLEVLRLELLRLNVKLKLNEKICSITPETDSDTATDANAVPGENKTTDINADIIENPPKWAVKTKTWTYRGDTVILACGSKAVPATGSDGSGYALARQLGLAVCEPAPALVPVTCADGLFHRLFGVRCRAKVALVLEDAQKKEHLLGLDTGEVQWTKYGVSGIVVFQLSRFVPEYLGKGKLTLHLDLLPEFSGEHLLYRLQAHMEQIQHSGAAQIQVSSLFSGILHEKLIPEILERAEIKKSTKVSELTQAQMEALIAQIKDFTLEVRGTKSFDAAQVCAGGVKGSELSPKTLESFRHAGLYVTGELVDVDGPCGGYNLQWAWSSGYVAGTAAAKGGAGESYKEDLI